MVTEKSSFDIGYMNIAKGLGIVAVVVGHSDSPFMQFIYLFHMSLFFFISGYFYKDKYSKRPVSLIKKRLRTIYLPFIKYELIFILLHNVFYYLGFYSDKYGALSFVKSLGTAVMFKVGEPLLLTFWFLGSLFIVNVLFSLISWLAIRFRNAEALKLLICVILFIVSNLATLKGFTIPRIGNAMVALLVFYFGYLFRKYEKGVNFNFTYALVCFIVLVINTRRGWINMAINQYASPEFFLINAICGVYCVIYLAKLLESSGLAKALSKLGQSTIPIMALQFLAFKLVMLIQIKYFNLPMSYISNIYPSSGRSFWWVAFSIIGIVLPYLFQQCLEKLKALIRNDVNLKSVDNA